MLVTSSDFRRKKQMMLMAQLTPESDDCSVAWQEQIEQYGVSA